MQNDIKKINGLFISSYFPPEKNGAVGRIFSLYKYLPNEGIHVHVLTKNINDKEYPNVKRLRSINDFDKNHSIKKMVEKVKQKIMLRISTEEDRIWEANAFNCAIRLIKDNNIDFIYATFPNFSTFRIALKIRKLFKIPLIIEYRDGLSIEPLYRMNFIKRFFAYRLESDLIKESKFIITVGETLSNNIKSKFSNSKVITVRNGYLEEDYYEMRRDDCVLKNEKIVICNFGNWNNSRKGFDIELLYNSLDDANYAEKLQLILFGNYTKKERKLLSKLNYKYNTEMIIFKDSVEKAEGFRYIKENCDVLLLLGIKNFRGFISQKLLEYLNLEKPIIGICKDSEAEEIIYEAGLGEVSDFTVSDIRRLFSKAIEWNLYYFPNKDFIESFNRKSQAKIIAKLIKELEYH